VAALAIVIVVLLDAAHDASADDWLDNERLAGIAWVGAQKDLTGLMIDDVYTLSGPNYGSRAPKLQYDHALLDNVLVSHLLLPARSALQSEAESAGFEAIRTGARYVVLRRRPPARPTPRM
jgi:hypothetical protein